MSFSWDASLFCRAEGSQVFHPGLNRKMTSLLHDVEDTGGLSSDLRAFRCVFRSGVKRGREGCPDHPVIHIIPCCWGTRPSCVWRAVCTLFLRLWKTADGDERRRGSFINGLRKRLPLILFIQLLLLPSLELQNIRADVGRRIMRLTLTVGQVWIF